MPDWHWQEFNVMYWKKLSKSEIKDRVFGALSGNVDFYNQTKLGVPGSHLDDKVFYQDAPFLDNAPFLTTLIRNPNHIGCHTLGQSESFFKGTQKIELELIALCAEDIFEGEAGAFDGYVASGGTEANLQAIWIYRNYFRDELGAGPEEICILTSEDAHYSMSKAADVLSVPIASVPVDSETRAISQSALRDVVAANKQSGAKYFIVVVNMMTTMFGSVDDVDEYVKVLDAAEVEYKIHVDGAYGGFIYPFTNPDHHLNFKNPLINSVTLDAHKMVQAPYGTGIFMIRKGWMKFANTKSASYVEGEDYTLIGSRSGANAVAVWMILMTYGRFGWEEKMSILMKRTDWFANRLKEQNISFYRNPHSNIVTVRAAHVNKAIAEQFGLVPDNHHHPLWYKVVVMNHVTIEKLMPLVAELDSSNKA